MLDYKIMRKPERLQELRPRIVSFPETVYGGDNSKLVDAIDDLYPGDAILNRRYFGALSQAGLRAVFEEDDRLMEGRKGGLHQSYAGYLSFVSQKDQQIVRAVFVKPFQNGDDCRNGEPAKDMVHEIAVSDAITSLYTYPVTFKTLGIAKSYNGTPQLITELNMSITAISNIFRPKDKTSPEPSVDQIRKGIHIAMHQAGAWVGGLGSTHRDFHAGNVARGLEYTPWFNDNETVLPLETHRGAIKDNVDNRRLVLNDINRFFISVVKPKSTRSDVIRKIFSVLDNPQCMGSFLKTYQSSLSQSRAISGIEIPERYYMTAGTFTSLVMNSTQKARDILEG